MERPIYNLSTKFYMQWIQRFLRPVIGGGGSRPVRLAMLCLAAAMSLVQERATGQSADTAVHPAAVVPPRFLQELATRTARASESLTRQTTSYLDKLSRLEDR